MPKVGKKHYPYTPKGMARAKAAAASKGKKVQYKNTGGVVVGNIHKDSNIARQVNLKKYINAIRQEFNPLKKGRGTGQVR
tara:strand:+ start:405 stop:644 length:240 start_codon:yes stop_codon:yes gene_type:complete